MNTNYLQLLQRIAEISKLTMRSLLMPEQGGSPAFLSFTYNDWPSRNGWRGRFGERDVHGI